MYEVPTSHASENQANSSATESKEDNPRVVRRKNTKPNKKARKTSRANVGSFPIQNIKAMYVVPGTL